MHALIVNIAERYADHLGLKSMNCFGKGIKRVFDLYQIQYLNLVSSLSYRCCDTAQSQGNGTHVGFRLISRDKEDSHNLFVPCDVALVQMEIAQRYPLITSKRIYRASLSTIPVYGLRGKIA